MTAKITIEDVIGYRGPGNNTDIRRIPQIRRLFPRAYGAVLMSCVRKQTRLTFLLWRERFMCPDRLNSALKKLINEGVFPELLDIRSKNALYLIEKAYQQTIDA